MESTEDPDVAKSFNQSVRLVLPSEQKACESKEFVNLWKRALQKLQAVDLDPWLDFQLHDIPVRNVMRHRYSAIKKKWVMDEISVRLETVPFDRGAMRECFRLKKLSHNSVHGNDWQHASNYVAKRYINKVDKQVYFDDVRLQMEAKLWGEAFNRQNPPKKVDIFQLSVIELRPTPLDASSNDTATAAAGEAEFYHIERFMEGEYRKYNSNSGFVDEQLRNTPQAFSHFTFERSGHRLLVVDIQGVGDLYTDPQIHTADGVGYSDGNLGPRGMAYFFHSHRCNPLCEFLALTPFDLAPSELLDPSLPHFTPVDDYSGASDQALPNDCCCDTPSEPLEVENQGAVKEGSKAALDKFKPLGLVLRRRSVSFSQSLETCRFGPTVARSAENVRNSLPPAAAGAAVGPRRRGDSISVLSDAQGSDLSDDLATVRSRYQELHFAARPSSHFFANRGVTENVTQVKAREPFHTDVAISTNPVRDRFASGDSGYSGRSNIRMPYEVHFYARSLTADPVEDPFNISASSLTNSSFPTSPSPLDSSLAAPCSASIATEDEFGVPVSFAHQNPAADWLLFSGTAGRNGGGPFVPRRCRNLSESSDLDVEEDRRNAGNLLHQLMHETQRPSCATHPTNLDQEIGQSVLGQIHHELARLHEAGRFLPTSKGGWSHAGLGGLLLRDNDNDDDNDDGSDAHLNGSGGGQNHHHQSASVSSPGQTIDWAAVLFHEVHAAQLGCLEAMIVMAHYYLGLPTQLLLDCPIKPAETDLRAGLDYLWRAAEGGDRRCMILLARYLDVSATMSESPDPAAPVLPNPRDFLFLPMLHTISSMDALPSVSPDSWAEAVTWYQKAVDAARSVPHGLVDEGLDAEGGYDAAEDLLPVYRILARMAEMYSIGGFGLKQDFNRVGDLYNRAGELALAAFEGRLATKYFDLSEEAYAQCQ